MAAEACIPGSSANAPGDEHAERRAIDLAGSGHILYVSSVDVSLGNGPGVNEREFILSLHAALGSRAHFVIPEPEGPVADLPRDACTFTRPHRRHHPLHFILHTVSKVRRTRELLARRHFDLMVFRLDVLPLAALLIARDRKTPYALKTLGQNTLKILSVRGGWIGRALEGLNRWMVRRVVSRAIVADSVTELQADFLAGGLALDRSHVVCIDNAVNADRFRRTSPERARAELGLEARGPIIGYVGSRPSERGGMALVEATPRLLAKHPGLGVLIVGDGPGMDGLGARARELGVDDRCVFTGYVPFDRVPVHINAIDVAVSISSLADRRAASELKVRQYLACGKPVVISPGGNEFIAREGFGCVVDPDDGDAILAALDRWLALSPEQREEFAQRAGEYMRRHLSTETAMARRLSLWEERLGEP